MIMIGFRRKICFGSPAQSTRPPTSRELREDSGGVKMTGNFTPRLGLGASFSVIIRVSGERGREEDWFFEILPADVEEGFFVDDAADLVEELARGVGAGGDEVHGFFHFLDLGAFLDAGGADSVIEAADVVEDFGAGGLGDGSA